MEWLDVSLYDRLGHAVWKRYNSTYNSNPSRCLKTREKVECWIFLSLLSKKHMVPCQVHHFSYHLVSWSTMSPCCWHILHALQTFNDTTNWYIASCVASLIRSNFSRVPFHQILYYRFDKNNYGDTIYEVES